MNVSSTITDSRLPVFGLIEIISGDRNLKEADKYLHDDVLIHMDSTIHKGVTTWQKWIHLIRNRGLLDNLRLEPITIYAQGEIVVLNFRWSGNSKRSGGTTSCGVKTLRYRVRNGNICEIWTAKINYVEIFGGWICVQFFYRLFLLWALFYFELNGKRKLFLQNGTKPYGH